MGLALCHSLPRDVPVQVALLLYFVASILQAASIGLHTRNDGGGYFTLKNVSSSRSNALVLLAAHPATYIPPTSALHTSPGTAAQKLCNPSADPLTYSCARFAEAFHIVNGLTISSFITNFVVVLLGVFLLVRLSRSTLGLLFRLTYAACVPMVLQCAAAGCFFARVVPHARRDTALAAGYSNSAIKFHRRPAANLMISATALLCAGFVVLFVRWMSVICLRVHFEGSKEHTKKEVKQMTEAHMVNDDWTRQKQILLSHARSVQVEMAVKNPQKGEYSASATARSSEPFPPRPIDTNPEGNRNARHSSEDSDADTLHFRATSNVTPLTGHGSPGQGRASAGAGDSKGPTFDTGDASRSRTGQTLLPAGQTGEGNALDMSPEDTHPFSDAEVRISRRSGSAASNK
jgi:hypothetical protein